MLKINSELQIVDISDGTAEVVGVLVISEAGSVIGYEMYITFDEDMVSQVEMITASIGFNPPTY